MLEFLFLLFIIAVILPLLFTFAAAIFASIIYVLRRIFGDSV